MIKEKKKTLQKSGIEGIYLSIIKIIHDKLIVSITLNGEHLHAFIPTLETRQGCLLSPLVFKMVMDVLNSAMRQEKDTKGMHIRKEEIKPYY